MASDDPDFDLTTMGMLAHIAGHHDLGHRLLDEAEMREHRDRDPLAFLVRRIDISGLGLEGEDRFDAQHDREGGRAHIFLRWRRSGRYEALPLEPPTGMFADVDLRHQFTRTRWIPEVRRVFQATVTERILCEYADGCCEAIREILGDQLDAEPLLQPEELNAQFTMRHAKKIKIRTEREVWEQIKKERDEL